VRSRVDLLGDEDLVGAKDLRQQTAVQGGGGASQMSGPEKGDHGSPPTLSDPTETVSGEILPRNLRESDPARTFSWIAGSVALLPRHPDFVDLRSS
jgi:hypothetical protein